MNEEFKRYVMFGSGNHAVSIGDLLESLKVSEIYVLAASESSKNATSYPLIDKRNALLEQKDTAFVLAIGNQEERNNFIQNQINVLGGKRFPSLIHPTAFVSNRAKLEFGVVIFAFAYIGPMVQIGDFSIANTGCIIEHGTKVGIQSLISPGVTIAGNVEIGDNVFLGVNSCVAPGVKIHSNSTVGANSFVKRDVLLGESVYGSPSKAFR